MNLVNNSTDSVHRILAHDTIQAGDSSQIEYLEGYIIRNIPHGSDSFYVQLVIDTVNADGYGGGFIDGGGAGGGGDNPGFKRKIFWENEKPSKNISNIPTKFSLYQNFPNPFNPVTTIKYDLPKDVKVTIKIYDILGREVETLINNELRSAGRYEINWNANKYASGVYIYRIEARRVGSSTSSFVDTKKMVLLK